MLVLSPSGCRLKGQGSQARHNVPQREGHTGAGEAIEISDTSNLRGEEVPSTTQQGRRRYLMMVAVIASGIGGGPCLAALVTRNMGCAWTCLADGLG